MNDDVLDGEIRDAVEPDAETVTRVVRAALNEQGGRSPFSWPMTLATGALAVLIVTTVLLRTFGRRPDVPALQPPNARVTEMTNIDDTVVVRPTFGGVWLIGGAQKEGRLPSGTIVVHKSGDVR